MKNLFFSLLALLALSLAACSGNAQNSKQNAQNQPVVQVIDFHSTHRCMTCNAIEAQTKQTLEKYYPNELASGLLTFQTVNVDEKENYALAEAFEASGTALFIHIVKPDGSQKIDLTDFAFMNALSKNNAFETGLKAEMDKALAVLKN